MPIVAPNVCRYSIIQSYGGQLVVNIVDVAITDIGDLTTRDEEIFAIAGDIMNNWEDHIIPLVQPELIAQECRWVDLDSPDGSTGSRTSTSEVTWPTAGTQSGAPAPGHTCANMKKTINGARTQRAGMLKLAGISEGYTLDGSPNALDPAAISALNAAFEDFKDGINGAESGGTRNIVVVHTVDGEYSGQTHVNTFQCQPNLGTIRRRMPGYGA